MALTSLTNLQPIHVHSIGISTFDGSVSVGGTLTYEDVTNVDSIGIVTARDDINIITDGKKLNIGASADLQLHHTSNHSYIDDAGAGNLRLRSGTLEIQNLASSKTSAIFSSGGGQTLNFNNSTKFVTTNTGVVITGICTATSFSGDGSNLTGIAVDSTKIETGNTKVETIDTGSDGHIKVTTEGNERFRIDSNGNARLGPGGNNTNSTNYTTLTISNTAGGVVEFLDSGNNNIAGDLIGAEGSGMYLSSKQDTPIIFRTGASNTEKMNIASDGNVHINTTDNGNASAKLNIEDSSSVGVDVLKIMNKPSGANGKAKLVFHTETSAGQGCQPYIQSLSGADAGPNASNNHNAGGLEFHTRSGGSGTDNNALRLRDDGTFEKYGTSGNILLTSTGSDIEFTRGGRNRLSATNSSGYFDFHTGGQYSFPAIRIFATPDVTTGAKVGINTDTIGVDTQMSVMASPGKPALYSSYGIRIMPNGANSFNYPSHYITNAAGVYVINATIPANNTWTQVAAGRYHGATVTCRVGDASSKRTIFANYDFTAPNYGVSSFNEIANTGGWNTGGASMRISSAGTYDFSLEVQHNSYYNTSNNSSVQLIFNVA